VAYSCGQNHLRLMIEVTRLMSGRHRLSIIASIRHTYPQLCNQWQCPSAKSFEHSESSSNGALFLRSFIHSFLALLVQTHPERTLRSKFVGYQIAVVARIECQGCEEERG